MLLGLAIVGGLALMATGVDRLRAPDPRRPWTRPLAALAVVAGTSIVLAASAAVVALTAPD